MTKRITYTIFAALACIALIYGGSGSVRAADERGMLQGVVKDAAGAPIAGAVVKMKDAQKRLTMMVINQDQGRYTARGPAGTWVVPGVGGDYPNTLSAAEAG